MNIHQTMFSTGNQKVMNAVTTFSLFCSFKMFNLNNNISYQYTVIKMLITLLTYSTKYQVNLTDTSCSVSDFQILVMIYCNKLRVLIRLFSDMSTTVYWSMLKPPKHTILLPEKYNRPLMMNDSGSSSIKLSKALDNKCTDHRRGARGQILSSDKYLQNQ